MTDYGIGIVGSSHTLGSVLQSNEEVCSRLVETTPEWIVAKTGIKQRYHISDEQSASSLAITVAKELVEKLNVSKDEIGLVIVASFSQDYLFPPLSAKLHSELSLPKTCQIIDVNVNCTGFVTALTIASERMICDNTIKKALVVGVEVLSSFTNPEDKDTAIFFSDGAAGILLEQVEKDNGYIASSFLTDSSTYESVRMRGGGSSFPLHRNNPLSAQFIEQNGLATWKQAVTNLPVVINALLKKASLSTSEIDFVIFHQANHFLINYIMQKMKIPVEKTYMNVQDYGNTGSASIGIALSEAMEKGLIKKGFKVVIAGVGAGFNFGACLFQF